MASRRGLEIDGVLLLDKPDGLSSNHALQRARRALNARKAGHTGTLDPFATGLLVCCLGRATKICGLLLDADKGYRATIKFGEETDSGDRTGNITRQAENFSGVDLDALRETLLRYTGTQQQVPPMYSALKRDGKPLYEYARAGIELVREPRTITIHSIELLSFDGMQAVIEVSCSKGTYIRTLADDIGRTLGCGAHLSALSRTFVGPFQLSAAIGLDALQSMPEPLGVLLPLDGLPSDLSERLRRPSSERNSTS
jgi:tRNA pseudouridine55 synthase